MWKIRDERATRRASTGAEISVWVGRRNKGKIVVASGRHTSTAQHSTSTAAQQHNNTALSLSRASQLAHSTMTQRHRAPPTPPMLDRSLFALSLDQSMPKDPGAR
jgi:hypothetical protein